MKKYTSALKQSPYINHDSSTKMKLIHNKPRATSVLSNQKPIKIYKNTTVIALKAPSQRSISNPKRNISPNFANTSKYELIKPTVKRRATVVDDYFQDINKNSRFSHRNNSGAVTVKSGKINKSAIQENLKENMYEKFQESNPYKHFLNNIKKVLKKNKQNIQTTTEIYKNGEISHEKLRQKISVFLIYG